MKKYDSHSHTNHSLDAFYSMDEMCASAIEKGVTGLTVSDHADIFTYEKHRSFEMITESVKEIELMQKKYAGRLRIFKSVELGDMYASAEATEQLKGITQYDVLLGSVHAVPFEEINDFFSQVSFDEKSFPLERINAFLREYFSLVQNMIDTNDFDVVCHLTCPLRYMRRKYGRTVDIKPFYPQIETILKSVIKKDLALEVNASGFDGKYDPEDSFLPSEDVLKMYFDLGGRKITLGSDAHSPDKVANRFDEVAEILKGLGFKSYCYFENRKATEVPFD